MDKVTDPVGFLTAIAQVLGLLCVAIAVGLAYQAREDLWAGVKRILGRYVRVQQPAGVAVWDMEAGAAAIEAAAREDRREAAARQRMATDASTDRADEPADRQTAAASVRDPIIARLQVDRTRSTVVDVLTRAGWDAETVRAALTLDTPTAAALRVDKTRTALIEHLLADYGWDVAEIRQRLRGDNSEIGREIAAARERLALGPPRTIVAREHRDGQLVEREIAMEESA